MILAELFPNVTDARARGETCSKTRNFRASWEKSRHVGCLRSGEESRAPLHECPDHRAHRCPARNSSARALHELSPVAQERFAICNCSALVDTLLESQLFGHMRGAFTGATDTRPGLFEYANGGTVFLDEIGETSLAMQAKLLRVIQNREIQRVGSPEVKTVDVRLIAATNRDLRAEVLAGRFREDLFYRLSSIEIRVPGLARSSRRHPHPASAFPKEI